MLVRLRIKDYILIDELEIDFSEGFNVLTGETGAGKSILLGAIRLVLGERVNGTVVRQGQTKAVIQALFETSSDQSNILNKALNREETENSWLLSREFLSSGKNICKINGDLCSVADLKIVGDMLMAIHGQHDHQQLAHSDYQLLLLDQYMSGQQLEQYQELKALVREINQTKKALEQSVIDPSAIEREIDLIQFQMEDIDQAALCEEDQTCEQRLEAMKHSEALIQDLEFINFALDSESGEMPSLIKLIGDVQKRLERMKRYMPQVGSRVEWLTDMLYQARDFKAENEAYISDLQIDGYELLALEKRVDTINHLKRKYGHDLTEILDFRASLDQKLDQLSHNRTQKDVLLNQLALLESKYWSLAHDLTKVRMEHAKRWSQALEKVLGDLNFADARAEVVLERRGHVHALGDDHMELFISLNKGMPLAPLKKVASGGEISRVMLAIKSLAAKLDQVATLIFDEIDAGISGHTASVVAEKLYQVSRNHQVICISHLGQVALMADAHFLIEKSSQNDQTLSRVSLLDEQGRVDEIARIIGGAHQTAEISNNALKLLQTAALRKEQLL